MDIKAMMAKAQELQKKMEAVQEELAGKHVEFNAGAGMVTAIVNGKHELIELKIADEAISTENIDMLKDLIVAAVNGAMIKANDLIQSEMQKVTSDLGLPPNLNL